MRFVSLCLLLAVLVAAHRPARSTWASPDRRPVASPLIVGRGLGCCFGHGSWQPVAEEALRPSGVLSCRESGAERGHGRRDSVNT